MIVDANVFIGTGYMNSHIRVFTTGFTCRNSYFYNGGFTTRTDGSGNALTVFLGRDVDGGTDNKPYPVEVYNNTYWSARDIFSLQDQNFGSIGYSDVSFENNIKRDTADTDVDVTTAIAGWTPRYLGQKLGFPLIPHTLGATWTNGGTFTISYPAGTDQAYWTALVGTDDFHMIELVTDDQTLYADASDFSVSFDASVITFTNNTGADISTQATYIKLDRASQLTVNSAYAATSRINVAWWSCAASIRPSTFASSSVMPRCHGIPRSD